VKAANKENGPYTWEARDAFGRVLASVNFSARPIADLPDRDVQLFSFVAPLSPDALQIVQSIRVRMANQPMAQRSFTTTAPTAEQLRLDEAPNRTVQVVWDSEKFPVLMLRDTKTGEVRGFVRGGNTTVEDAPDDMEVVLPDAIRQPVMRYRRVGK